MTMERENGGWRAGAAAVATLTFDVDAETPVLATSGHYASHLTTMSHQAFGPDVAVPRILDVLDQLEVPATFFVPGWVAERRPGLVPTIIERGHEVAHHSYSHRPATELSPQEQRDDFERALEVFDRQGVAVTGHRAATWQTTTTTFELLAEHGLAYDSSMMGDDRPYVVTHGGSSTVELPVHWSLDDWEQYAFLPDPHVGAVIEAPSKVYDLWSSELDAMREFGCLFNLCLHPFLSGRPGRLAVVRRLVERAREHGDVSFERCGDLAARVADVGGVRQVGASETAVDPGTFPSRA
jgi:peptidoglycan/xylan/chitin deacetylase (PgdA/CDA1 family)